MLFKSYIPGNDTFVFILNLDISRPVLHSTFDIQMGKIDIDNMSSVYIRRPLCVTHSDMPGHYKGQTAKIGCRVSPVTVSHPEDDLEPF